MPARKPQSSHVDMQSAELATLLLLLLPHCGRLPQRDCTGRNVPGIADGGRGIFDSASAGAAGLRSLVRLSYIHTCKRQITAAAPAVHDLYS